jgi:hypothetical protein
MMIKKIKTLYEAIKFEHTIFALPFAYLGHGFSSAWHTNAMANYLDYPGNGRSAQLCDGTQSPGGC